MIILVIYIGDLDDEQVIEDFGEAGDENDEMEDEETEHEVIEEVPETPERDDAKLTFSQHKAPIFCAALHPTENLAGIVV